MVCPLLWFPGRYSNIPLLCPIPCFASVLPFPWKVLSFIAGCQHVVGFMIRSGFCEAKSCTDDKKKQHHALICCVNLISSLLADLTAVSWLTYRGVRKVLMLKWTWWMTDMKKWDSSIFPNICTETTTISSGSFSTTKACCFQLCSCDSTNFKFLKR